MRAAALVFVILSGIAAAARAGYEAPNFIDACRSVDGRFEIHAKNIAHGKTSHGPNRWNYIWKDTKTGETREFPARALQGGQIYGQLFIAPDGKTFALWNHITMFWPEKSHMHASSHRDVVKKEAGESAFRNQTIFKNRLIIYRDDGTVLKTLHVSDFLQEGDWRQVIPLFNRIEWIRPYADLQYKSVTRTAYAFTRVSPDYTILEFQVGDRRQPRPVRVSLIDGTVLPADAALPDEHRPVMLVDAKQLPKGGSAWGESYTPSIDPVREAGTYRIDTIPEAYPAEKAPKKREDFQVGDVTLLADGFEQADTPSWMKAYGKKPEEAARLLFTDLPKGRLFSLMPGDAPLVLREGATRGRLEKGRNFTGLVDGKICRWFPFDKAEPEVLVDRELSVNDLAVSSRGLIYFTTLKDPENGRVSLLNPKTGEVTVLFDGNDHPALANPNGIALDRHERFLYVGISNYKNRRHSGIYAFPLRGDGTIAMEKAADTPRFPVKGPDGLATDREGNVYCTAGNMVRVFSPFAKPLVSIKIPKGSGTNLCFGGSDRMAKTLFITTRNAVYSIETPVGGG